MTGPYDPYHIALQQPRVIELEPYLSLEQCQTLIAVWQDGWRMVDQYPVLHPGFIEILARKRVDGGPDEDGSVWQLQMKVTNTGQIIDRRELDA
jgi:hypothetical protein